MWLDAFFRRGVKSEIGARRRRRGVVRGEPPCRAMRLEPLEDRRMLGLGNLLHTLDDPSVNPQTDSSFGSAVAADADLTVVGAPDVDLGGFVNTGRAYVFNSATGTLVATLENPTPAAYDSFGCSVAVSGSTVVVGADGDDTGASNAGAAYVFDLSGPAPETPTHTLANPAPAAYD
jgi:hypothetical protein